MRASRLARSRCSRGMIIEKPDEVEPWTTHGAMMEAARRVRVPELATHLRPAARRLRLPELPTTRATSTQTPAGNLKAPVLNYYPEGSGAYYGEQSALMAR